MMLPKCEDSRQGILPFMVELAKRDDVTARAGLTLVVETVRAFQLDEIAQKELPSPQRKSEFLPEEKLEALMVLLAAGGDRVEDIRILNEDKGLLRLLNRSFPSPDTLLDFLGQFHDTALWEQRPVDKKAWVPPESEALRALENIQRAFVSRVADPSMKTATIDHDGTIIEAHKQDAKIAYEGTRGYQPLVAVWAEEQLIVSDEFRDGNVAGGEDPLSSVQRAFQNLPSWIEQRYFRADSAAYYAPLLKYLVKEEIGFAISADMTKPLREVCMAVPDKDWIEMELRAREEVHVAEIEFAPGDWPKDARPLRYIAFRITPLQNELLEPRATKYLAIVSNRTDLSAIELIDWHRGKAGTIEHVHRTLKDELGAGVMPSGKFGANAAWFRINALTFNVFTALKRHALPERYRMTRPKRLRFEIFTAPGKIATHQSAISVRVAGPDILVEEFVQARKRLLARFHAHKNPITEFSPGLAS